MRSRSLPIAALTKRPLSRKRIPNRAIAALTIPAALVLTACSASSLDTKKLENVLSKEIAKSNEVGAEVGAATCPKSSDVKLVAGGTFECTVVVDGKPAHFTIKQKDNKGNVEWRRTDALLDLKALQKEIVSGLHDQAHVDAQVECGNVAVLPVKPGTTFDCIAKADGNNSTVKVTVKDIAGNITWKVG